MPNLKDCSFKGSYDSNFDNNIVEDFFVPLLSNSTSYDRMSGFFTSESLALAIRGIQGLIKNKGHMRLITSPYLNDNDSKIIQKYHDNPIELRSNLSKIIETILNDDFCSTEESNILGWMLLNQYLEIRIVLVTEEESILNGPDAYSSGIFHNKIGIAKDNSGNIVSFSGSINETKGGWKNNIESFEVFCNWEQGSDKHIAPHITRFESYWNIGKTNRTITVELPEAVKNKWIKSIPKNFSPTLSKHSGFALRNYQERAIQAWAQNNYRGIFNMATGTGKTITAIFGIKELISTMKNFVLIVAVPFQHLIKEPWKNEIDKFLLKDVKDNTTILAFSGNKKWESELSDAILDYKLKTITSIVIISTYDTLSSTKFLSHVEKVSHSVILVTDEVHNSGADTYRNCLNPNYPYRLGLSATPARYLDDDGTSFIEKYFEKEVFNFDISKAITEINPDTGKTYLAPYYYHPIFVNLNSEEITKYREYSHKIAKIPRNDPTPDQINYRQHLMIQRSRIVKNANNKINVFKDKIKEFKDNGVFDHCLIYCSDGKDASSDERTITTIISLLNSFDINSRRFTSDDSFDERRELLDLFSKGEISTLVAIKCLDEGVDVPSTKNAIIMASTGNPREFIQRRGRILRPSANKQYATLYDFVVVPNDNPKDRDTELQVLKSEYLRFDEFSRISINSTENDQIFRTILQNKNINPEFLEENRHDCC